MALPVHSYKQAGWLFIASIASGCMLLASLPPFDHGLLAFVSFVPALAVLRRAGILRAIISSLLIMAPAFALLLLASESGLVSRDSTQTLRVLLGLLTLVIVPLCLYAVVKKWSPLTVWALVALSVFWEAAVSHYFPATLAWTQHRSPGMLYLASVTGWWGISAALWATNLFTTRVLFLTPLRRATPSALACVFTVTGAALIYPPTQTAETTLKVRILGANEISATRIRQHNAAQKSELIVFPRIEIPRNVLVSLSAGASIPTAVITHEGESWVWKAADPNSYASVEQIRGHVISVPLALESPLVHNLLHIWRDAALVAVPRDTPASPYKLLASCDAAGMALASASLGVPIARADTSGFNQITGPTGEIISSPEADGSCTAEVPTPYTHQPTIYAQIGDWMPLFLIAILLLRAIVWALQALGLLLASHELEAPLRILPRIEQEPYSRN